MASMTVALAAAAFGALLVAAVVVAMLCRRHGRRRADGKVFRCRHCGFVAGKGDVIAGKPRLCPRCGLAIDEVHLA